MEYGIIVKNAACSGILGTYQQNVIFVTPKIYYIQSLIKSKVGRMSDWCENKDCEFYGRRLVDLGWGYPVCRCEFVKRYPVPMDPKYKGFDKYYEIVKCNEVKTRRK